ncbi:MAG: response regulator [Myxococcaceae bacterium]
MREAAPLFGELLLKLGVATERQLKEALALQSLTGQRVGEALVTLGYVSREQLQRALFEALGLPATEAQPPKMGELLVRLKHISNAQLETALTQQRGNGRRLGEILVEMGVCQYKHIYEALALQGRRDIRHETAPLAKLEVTQAPGKPDAPRRVVIVDDSPVACALVTEGLKASGYDVFAFEDPFQALDEVFRLRPDIVLSDLQMPGMDGTELCRRLKDGPARAIPVIILTASENEAQRVGGLRAGADDYVSKTASLDEIFARIESVLRRTGETERMRKLFARYTSDAVVDEVLKNPSEVVLTGEKREVTVLFADIRHFTSLSETLPPEQVVGLLNAVLARLAEAVLTCGGTLDKFLGDGLMAVFGAPVRRSDDALRALQSARMMMEAVAELPGSTEGGHLELGIGINSGVAIVGNLGSAQRTEYTCIGDAVNVASRLCAIASPGEILVGSRTRELVGQEHLETLPPVKLKGKSQPVEVYRVPWGVVANPAHQGAS